MLDKKQVWIEEVVPLDTVLDEVIKGFKYLEPFLPNFEKRRKDILMKNLALSERRHENDQRKR